MAKKRRVPAAPPERVDDKELAAFIMGRKFAAVTMLNIREKRRKEKSHGKEHQGS